MSISEAAKSVHVSIATINSCCEGKISQVGGHTWSFSDDGVPTANIDNHSVDERDDGDDEDDINISRHKQHVNRYLSKTVQQLDVQTGILFFSTKEMKKATLPKYAW